MNTVSGLIRRAFGMPSGTPAGIVLAWRILFPSAVVLWCLTLAGCCRGWDWRAMSIVHDAAVAAVVIAANCRLGATRISEDRRILNRALGDAVSLIPADRRREMQMRKVSGH